MRELFRIFRLTGLVLLFAMTPAHAVDPPAWVTNAPIYYITVQPNGRVYLRLTVAVPDLGCAGNTHGYLEFDTNAPHFEAQFSLILAAHAADKPVTVYVNNCGHYPYVQNTRVL